MFMFRGKNVVEPFLPFISLNVLAALSSMEFIWLMLLYVSVANAFSEVRSSKLNICWICSHSLSSLDVGQSFAK